MRRPLYSPPPLVSEDGSSDTVGCGGGGQLKGKSTNPPGLGRYQQRGDKLETAVILFIVFSVGLCVDGQGWRWGVKYNPCIGSVPVPGLRSLMSVFSFSHRHSGGGSASVSPLVKI